MIINYIFEWHNDNTPQQTFQCTHNLKIIWLTCLQEHQINNGHTTNIHHIYIN